MDNYFTANAVLSMFSKNYTDLKKGLPIRPSEMAVLKIITQTPAPHTPVLLAELLRVSKPMVTAYLTALSKKDYIRKKQSPEDKRVFYILPTEKALELVESAKTELNEHLEQLIKQMGQDEFDNLVRLAGKANEVLGANQRDNK